MKKLWIPFMIFIILLLAACNERDLPLEETLNVDNSSNQPISDSTGDPENHTETPENIDTIVPYQFMYDGKLYIDTGEVESGLKCGVMDINFTTIIPSDQVPSKDGEANFASESNGAQIGRRDNRMVAYAGGEWRIFAYNEDTLNGMTMSVSNPTASSLTLIFDNKYRKEFTFGEWFMIEKYDEEHKEWMPLEQLCEYTSIGYIIKAAAVTEHEIDFTWLYGELDSGEYRIIENVLDVREPGAFDTYWFMAEFTIE